MTSSSSSTDESSMVMSNSLLGGVCPPREIVLLPPDHGVITSSDGSSRSSIGRPSYRKTSSDITSVISGPGDAPGPPRARHFWSLSSCQESLLAGIPGSLQGTEFNNKSVHSVFAKYERFG